MALGGVITIHVIRGKGWGSGDGQAGWAFLCVGDLAGLLGWVGRVWPEGICVELGGDEGFLVTVRFILLPQEGGAGFISKRSLAVPPAPPAISQL